MILPAIFAVEQEGNNGATSRVATSHGKEPVTDTPSSMVFLPCSDKGTPVSQL